MNARSRWWVLGLISVAIAGDYYAWDSIAPVADLLRRQLGLSQSQIGLLNAVYAVPNIFLCLVGGILPRAPAFWRPASASRARC